MFHIFHEILLKDQIRLEGFSRAIEEHVKPGMRVLDVGSGTGILAMLAVRAGAESVVAIERNPLICSLAKEIAQQNKYQGKITFISADFFAHEFQEKFDVIISETIGNFALEEGILSIAKRCLDFLKPGGVFLPQELRLLAAPLYSTELEKRMVPLQNIREFDYSPLLERLYQAPIHMAVSELDLRGSPENMMSINLSTPSSFPLIAEHHFDLVNEQKLNGIGLFMEIVLTETIKISTVNGIPMENKTN